MKLREYGYLIWKLSMDANTNEETIGKFASDLAVLVEDWSLDNELRDSNNVEWIQEPYNDWVSSKQKEASS